MVAIKHVGSNFIPASVNAIRGAVREEWLMGGSLIADADLEWLMLTANWLVANCNG